jgi:hypothetical protein
LATTLGIMLLCPMLLPEVATQGAIVEYVPAFAIGA